MLVKPNNAHLFIFSLHAKNIVFIGLRDIDPAER